jgi:PAS domain S-box-containing protein
MSDYRTMTSPFNIRAKSANGNSALKPDDDALQAALAENRLLFEIGTRLNAATHYDDVMRAAVAVGSATVGSLAVFDLDEQGRPQWANALAAWVGEPGLGSALTVGVRVPVAHLHDAQIWLQQPDEPFLVGDVATDPRLAPLARSLDLQAGTYARVVMPLRPGGRWLGFITLGWPEKRTFGEAERRLYKLFAAQAGLVVHNLRLATEAKTTLAGALRQQTTQQAILDNLPIGVFVAEAKTGAPQLVNKVGLELLGRGVDPQRGKEDDAEVYQIFVPGTDRLYLTEDLPLVRAMTTGEVARGEVDIQRPDSRITVEVMAAPVLDAERHIVAAVALFQDITERKQTEGALAKRAAELATVMQVSAAATTLLSAEQLLQEVVDLTKTSFGLYHAHIYLLDDPGDTLVLTSGAGEVGRQMVADGRQIPLDREQSLVARAARTRQGIIVNDVRNDPGFLPHPLLPETRSELAVPIVVGDVLLGVFDVQSSSADHFTEEDVRIQTALAAQVAVALQNARVYARARQQVQRETLVNTISQKIQSATTVESALQIAARELGRALQAPRTTVQLSAPGLSADRRAK